MPDDDKRDALADKLEDLNENKQKMVADSLNRRRFVTTLAIGSAGMLAGCTGNGGESTNGDGQSTTTPADASGEGDEDTNSEDPYAEQVTLNTGATGLVWVTSDPAGSRFMEEYNVDLTNTAIDTTPSSQLQRFVSGSGQEEFDAIWDNGGGMEQLLWNNDIVADTDPIENVDNWGNLRAEFKEGGRFESYYRIDGNPIAYPSLWNADSVAYREDEIDEPDSWGVLFDDELKGKTGMIDDYGHAIHITALYIRENNREDIHNVDLLSEKQLNAINNISGNEIDSIGETALEGVIDYLIGQKQMGQFRTVWSSFGNILNLFVNNEITVSYAFQPVAKFAQAEDEPVGYATLKEGPQIFQDNFYLTKGGEQRNRDEAYYRLGEYSFSAYYGAEHLRTSGLSPVAKPELILEYAEENYDQETIDQIKQDQEARKERLTANGNVNSVNNPFPENLELYLDEWERFQNA